MKRLFALLALLAATALLAAPSAEREAFRHALLKGVTAIDLDPGCLTGPLLIVGEDAVPLALAKNADGTAALAAAAALVGKGRLLCLSHDGFLKAKLWQRDTRRLLLNFIQSADPKGTARLAILRNPSARESFESLAVRPVHPIASPSHLRRGDILVCSGLKPDEHPAVLKHLRAGGSLILANLGWGFRYFHPNEPFAESFADNRLTAPLGILMGNTTAARPSNQGFPAVTGTLPPGTLATDALAAAASAKPLGAPHGKQVSATLTLLVNALPAGSVPELEQQLVQLSERSDSALVPRPNRPIGAGDILARLALIARQRAWLANPEKPCSAAPAAAVYPGLARANAPKVTRTVALDLTVPRWHSTGVFAPAGAPLTVEIPPEACRLGLKVRIGSTADDLTSCAEWKRAPLVTVEHPLRQVRTTLSSPYGGLVYLVVPAFCGGSRSQAKISGGIMAPWFRLGVDSAEKFRRECRESGAPYGEIQGEKFIISAEVSELRNVRDPEWIARYWDRVVEACRELAQGKGRGYPERICSDVQLTGGWMHSGYPVMTHCDANTPDWVLDRPRMAAGAAWGIYHELGHNHQNTDWTPEGTAEVTVNLFTCHAIERVAGADIRAPQFYTSATAARKRVREWVAKGGTFGDWKRDPFLALEVYIRIKEVYGWELYKRVFGRYLEPGFRRPATNDEKWQVFARELSDAAGADLGAVLAAWSIPLSQETLAYCRRHPAAPKSLTAGLARAR
ncbi:MAG: M60 family metallopeptidase [Kiritimatiellia bacterium]